MTNKEVQGLKKVIATAGAELLERSGTAAVLLPLDGGLNVAVGTLEGIAKVAGGKAVLTDERIWAIWNTEVPPFEDSLKAMVINHSRAIEAAVLAAPASADNPSTAGAAKPVGSIGDYTQFHKFLCDCYEACAALDNATGREVFDASDKLTDAQNKLVDYINDWSAHLATPASQAKPLADEVRDKALEEAARVCEVQTDPTRPNTTSGYARWHAAAIRALKSQGDQGEKGGG